MDRNWDLSVKPSSHTAPERAKASEGEGDSTKRKHGVVFVGHNKVAIPKFDPAVIEKYNKLNIEGKLPHIVETNKFDPEAVKQQVKDMFRDKLMQYE